MIIWTLTLIAIIYLLFFHRKEIRTYKRKKIKEEAIHDELLVYEKDQVQYKIETDCGQYKVHFMIKQLMEKRADKIAYKVFKFPYKIYKKTIGSLQRIGSRDISAVHIELKDNHLEISRLKDESFNKDHEYMINFTLCFNTHDMQNSKINSSSSSSSTSSTSSSSSTSSDDKTSTSSTSSEYINPTPCRNGVDLDFDCEYYKT